MQSLSPSGKLFLLLWTPFPTWYCTVGLHKYIYLRTQADVSSWDTRRTQVKALENGATVTVRGMSDGDAELWKHIRSATSKTNRALVRTSDEGGWTDAVLPILEATMASEEDDLFGVMDVYGFPPRFLSFFSFYAPISFALVAN